MNGTFEKLKGEIEMNNALRSSNIVNGKLKIPVERWESSSFTVAIKIKSSLVSIRFCSAVLGISEVGVMHLIESGDISWAWDFRRKNARRSFVFVLAQSLRQYQEKIERRKGLKVRCPDDLNEIVRIILPNDRQLIKGSDLVRSFSISSQHMMNLVNDGLLKAVNVNRRRTSTPLITRDSIIAFLKARLL